MDPCNERGEKFHSWSEDGRFRMLKQPEVLKTRPYGQLLSYGRRCHPGLLRLMSLLIGRLDGINRIGRPSTSRICIVLGDHFSPLNTTTCTDFILEVNPVEGIDNIVAKV